MSAIASDGTRKVRWRVEELRTGSLTAVVCPESEDEAAADRAIDIYEEIGRCAASGIAPPFSDRISKAARKLCGLINGRITSIDFSTSSVFYEAVSPIEAATATVAKSSQMTEAFGSVRGRAQTVSDRHGVHFTLFDLNDDHAIDCYASEDMKPSMRNAWGKMCTVSGIVRRHANGKIAIIRAIANITVLEETTKTSWRDAVGCSPAMPGSISTGEAIRRVRDDE